MPIKTLLLLAWGVLWYALQWVFGNFLYGCFIRYLDMHYHVKEADVIASVSSYVVPAVLSCIVVAFVYLLGRRPHISTPGNIAAVADGLACEPVHPILPRVTVDDSAPRIPREVPAIVNIMGDQENIHGLIGTEKLFRVKTDRSEISLLFFPNTGPAKRADALLLIIYGYKALLGIDSVKKSIATFAVNEALATAPNSPVPHFIAQLQSVMFYEQDYGIEYEKCGFLEVTGLSKGEFYRLTPDGEARAEQLAKDSISHA